MRGFDSSRSFLVAAKTSLHRYASRLDLFALLIAAAGHDVGHLAVGNGSCLRMRLGGRSDQR